MTGEDSSRHYSDLIFRPCFCFCVCEGGVVGIMGFYLTSRQRQLPLIKAQHVKLKYSLKLMREGRATSEVFGLYVKKNNIFESIFKVYYEPGTLAQLSKVCFLNYSYFMSFC